MNQIKYKWFEASADTLTYYPIITSWAEVALYLLLHVQAVAVKLTNNILALWFIISSIFQKMYLHAH